MIAGLLPVPKGVVERYYGPVFTTIQPFVTALSNKAPVALFDLLILVVATWWGLFIIGTLGFSSLAWSARLSAVVLRSAAAAAVVYLAFLALWGLNYRRVPLADKLQFDSRRVSPDRVLALAAESVDRLNSLYDRAHQLGWAEHGAPDPVLAGAFSGVQQAFGSGPVVPGRPKTTILDVYFRRAGVAGMTDPFFLETLIATDLLPFERPFVIAHEWSHLAGIADEGEANFAGWVACLRGSVAHQYSGWLFLYGELATSLGDRERRLVSDRLGVGPRRDLTAIRERLQREISPRVSAVGWRVYDRYLKANRIEAGAASYAEVVRLIAGVEFGPDWTPIRRH